MANLDPITVFVNETGVRVINKCWTDRDEGEPPWTNEELAVVHEYIKCLAHSGNANPASLAGVNIDDLSEKRRGQIQVRFVSAYVDNQQALQNCFLPFFSQPWFTKRLAKEIKERGDKLQATSKKTKRTKTS